jgi:parallel beta-helix repeat protein
MTFRLMPGATLQAESTSSSDYVVVLASGVANVTIVGGTILGNAANNTITDTDENGFGIKITDSQHIVVDGVTTRQCWCDGCYVGDSSQDVTLNNVVADGNRRNALSITSVNGMVVRGSTFENSTGFTEAGIFWSGGGVDIEPNPGETVANVQFLGCTFATNSGSGIGFGPAAANQGKAFVSSILVDGCRADGNGFHNEGCGIGAEATRGNQISNNTVTATQGIGIYLRSAADDTLVFGNTVSGSISAPAPAEGWVGNGIELYATGGNTVTGNTIAGNAGSGLLDEAPTASNITSPNTVSGNGVAP